MRGSAVVGVGAFDEKSKHQNNTIDGERNGWQKDVLFMIFGECTKYTCMYNLWIYAMYLYCNTHKKKKKTAEENEWKEEVNVEWTWSFHMHEA